MKEKYLVEKETVIKEVRGEKLEKTTYRILVMGGNTRSIVFNSVKDFEAFRKEINKVKTN